MKRNQDYFARPSFKISQGPERFSINPSSASHSALPPSTAPSLPLMTQSLKGSGLPGFVSTSGYGMPQDFHNSALAKEFSMTHSLRSSGLPGYVSPNRTSPTMSSNTSPPKILSPPKLGRIPNFRGAMGYPIRFPSPVVFASPNTAEAQKREMIRNMKAEQSDLPQQFLTSDQQHVLISAQDEVQGKDEATSSTSDPQRMVPTSVKQTVVQQTAAQTHPLPPVFDAYPSRPMQWSPRRTEKQPYYARPPLGIEHQLAYAPQHPWSPIESPIPFEYIYNPYSDSDGSDFEVMTPRDGSPWEHCHIYRNVGQMFEAKDTDNPLGFGPQRTVGVERDMENSFAVLREETNALISEQKEEYDGHVGTSLDLLC